ncbi:hypothetical protein CBM2586_B130607 [Cupriavidus phytorum]|uniref:Uncharacterized protein n=1 Tax=Cupriavidus taiwanensis TaxID=164546 RepID=A0A375CJQ5_9BURK|nr:hypothetical protein CBM2586_B130607 [Cupriavidus taiwanensis]
MTKAILAGHQKTVAMRKLGVQTNTGLIRYAYESGLI